MASSSSSSSQSRKYDVFLSFRPDDTCKTFVDHLYEALVERQILTYKDDETLNRGESICPSHLKAIEESQVVVIIFSENYASSSLCLEELVYIMKCREETRMILMPIVYDADPPEVRKQSGNYRGAFSKHKLVNKKIESWREALNDASNLFGWEPKFIATDGNEAKRIRYIVGKVSYNLLSLNLGIDENLVGMENRLQDLKLQLNIGSGGVRMVGILGSGGGGKTTLASSLYLEIYDKFDSCCFVNNIQEESRKCGIETLQENILLTILKKEVKVPSVDIGKQLIKSRLVRRKVLIVLDDVDDHKQLQALAGSHDWFGDGSRIIITTKDEQLLTTHSVDEVSRVSLLSDEEAIRLFNIHAYKEKNHVKDYNLLAQHVVSYAGGLPLALKVLGSFLCDKDKDEWVNSSYKLKDIPEMEVVEILKVSYDALKPVEKELFLMIACFFKWFEKDEEMMMFDGSCCPPRAELKMLRQKALITISHKKINMHNLVKEMGVYVAGRDNPEKDGGVWQWKGVLNTCALDSAMENDMIKESTCDFCKGGHPPQCLSRVVANMNRCSWMCWTNFPANSLPAEFQPTNLRCMILRRGLQKILWEGDKHIPTLKVLDLHGSIKLIMTPDFVGLPNLEVLVLSGCSSLEVIHPSIGYLERLYCLNLDSCDKLQMFPPIINMKSLETLILSRCSQLRKFPEIKQHMDCLKQLYLDESGIEILPASIVTFCTSLVSINLIGCNNLRSIEGNYSLFRQKCLISMGNV